MQQTQCPVFFCKTNKVILLVRVQMQGMQVYHSKHTRATPSSLIEPFRLLKPTNAADLAGSM